MQALDATLDRRGFLGLAAGVALASKGALGAARSVWPEQVPFTFAVIADPHCAEDAKPGLEPLGGGVDKLLRCFETMEGLPEGERPDFALLAGDIHPEALAPHLSKIACPLHVVAGNHESSVKTRGLLRELFPGDFGTGEAIRDYYGFTHKGVRFIGLCDAGTGGEHVGQFSSELIEPSGQCDWFEGELAASGRCVVFAHIPPALDGGDRNMYMARNDSRWFLEVVRKTAPEMLFFGHLHQATEECRIGAARCVNLRSCSWNFKETPIGFMLVRVHAEGMDLREIITGEYKHA